MRSLDPDTLAALVAATIAATAGEHDDTREHAVMIAASLYRDRGRGFADVEYAARAARKIARRTVVLAATEVPAGLAEEMTDDNGTALTMRARWGTAPADNIARTTVADLVDESTAVAMRTDIRSGVALALAIRHARSHDEVTCARCVTTRPTLAGMTGHVDRSLSRHAATVARDEVRAAIDGLDPEAILSALDGDPLASPYVRKARTNLPDATPKTAPGLPMVNGRDLTAREAFMVRFPGCRAGAMAHTFDALGYPAALGYFPPDWDTLTECTCARPERWAGEEYGTDTRGFAYRWGTPAYAPARSWVSESRPQLGGDAAPSGKVPVSPRKRAGAGSTGPTVPVSLSRG